MTPAGPSPSSPPVDLTAKLEARIAELEREVEEYVFRFDSLSEATQELSILVEIRGLVETCLLTVMGAFGVRQGGIYFDDGVEPLFLLRGVEQAEEKTARERVSGFFQGTPQKAETALDVTVLSGRRQLAGSGFPFEAGIAAAFFLDGKVRGLLALGPRIGGREYGRADQALLKAHLAKMLAYVRAAGHFSETVALNSDLMQRNTELEQLLSEIAACRLELSDVEKARQRILALVRRETTRSESVRRMDFVFIFLLALVLGTVFNASNPAGISLLPPTWGKALPERAEAAEVWRDLSQGEAVLVDARPATSFRRLHIRGAVNMPRALFDFVYAMRFATMDPGTRIIVYGRTVSSRYDEEVAIMLRERGFSNVAVFYGGIPEWQKKGFPVEHGQ